MKKVIVYTRNDILHRRLYLLLSGEYEVLRLENKTSSDTTADVIIVDKDTCPKIAHGDVILTADEKAEENHGSHAIALPLPFSFLDLENALKNHKKRDTGRLLILEEERTAILDDVSIKLTEVEYRLLRTLLSVPIGEYVSKQKIVEEVWGDGVDGGVVNVYVHYLREKLEKNGERIIISTRNLGYKINERMVTLC